MNSFEYSIPEKSRVGSRFISHVRDELQRALASEKTMRKITQQQIATALETDRSVINRQIMGLENISLRRVAEILWAIGWEPRFEAVKIPAGENQYPAPNLAEVKEFVPQPTQTTVKLPYTNLIPMPAVAQ